MALSYPSPAGFAQSVCQRRRALDPSVALVVVEGVTDRRALLPFMAPTVVVIPSRGKPNALAAHERVRTESLPGVLVVVDCDGSTPAELKGRADLILSANRDIEADLLFELNALRRFAIDVVSDSCANLTQVESVADRILEQSQVVGSLLERARQAARSAGATTRLVDSTTGERRKVQPRDLPQAATWLAATQRPDLLDVAHAYAVAAGWDAATTQKVVRIAKKSAALPCPAHGRRNCLPCDARSLCVGHDLVELVAISLRLETGSAIDPREVDRGLRIASDGGLFAKWCVSVRGMRWAETTGVTLFGT